jgi:hypothetical protein
MRPVYRVTFTVEGRPFHVRRDHITSVGSGIQQGEVLTDSFGQPVLNEEGTDYLRDDPHEQVVITIEGLGNLPVDESLEDALRIWDGITRADLGVGDYER